MKTTTGQGFQHNPDLLQDNASNAIALAKATPSLTLLAAGMAKFLLLWEICIRAMRRKGIWGLTICQDEQKKHKFLLYMSVYSSNARHKQQALLSIETDMLVHLGSVLLSESIGLH